MGKDIVKDAKMNTEKDADIAVVIKTKAEMLKNLDVMLDEKNNYNLRLDAYEFLIEDCSEIVEDMLTHIYSVEGEAGSMLMEVLAAYKGNKAVYMGLVSYLYKGEDVALFARLLGSYGDENAVMVLKTFAENIDLDYNEFMEIRNAVEELGGDFDLKEDFSDDPFYRLLKGLDEEEQDSRKSPFEDLWATKEHIVANSEDDNDCDDDCDSHHHRADCEQDDDDCDDENCACHHHRADCKQDDDDCDDENCACHHHRADCKQDDDDCDDEDCDDENCACHSIDASNDAECADEWDEDCDCRYHGDC